MGFEKISPYIVGHRKGEKQRKNNMEKEPFQGEVLLLQQQT